MNITWESFPYESHTETGRDFSFMVTMSYALEEFKKDCNYYPSTEKGLMNLKENVENKGCWKGPYLYFDPPYNNIDGRGGKKFIYSSNKYFFVIIHYGADDKPGGKGIDEDLEITPQYAKRGTKTYKRKTMP